MRTQRRNLAATMGMFGLFIALAARPVSAQCPMMGGGGGAHDHGSTHDPSAKKLASSEKKQRESVNRLLSDEQGRKVLAEALLDDREFVREVIARIIEAPEWRALVTQRLAEATPERGAATAKSDDHQTAVYVCPMHPDVRSSKPGNCPNCGMALERAAPEHAH